MRRLRFPVFFFAAMLVPQLPASASFLTNGSLTGTVAAGSVPNGWMNIARTPDTNDINNAVGGVFSHAVTPDPSPDGGTWVGLVRNDAFNWVEEFGQDVTGLTIGQSYTVSWYAGNFGAHLVGSNAIAALIDGSVIGTGSVLLVGSDWFLESVSFVATATDHTLSFKSANATNTLGSQASYISIDGISMTADSNVVPEASSIAIWSLLGIVGIVGYKKIA